MSDAWRFADLQEGFGLLMPSAPNRGWRITHPWTIRMRPEVVTLCGSTRFVDQFNEWRKLLTLNGMIVLSIEIVTTQSKEEDPQHSDSPKKALLDELHLAKIRMSDFILVLNVGGYIGLSTRREIEHAESWNIPVEYLEEHRA